MLRYIGTMSFYLMMILGMLLSGCTNNPPEATGFEPIEQLSITEEYPEETEEYPPEEYSAEEYPEETEEYPEETEEYSAEEYPEETEEYPKETGFTGSILVGKECGGCGRRVSMDAMVGQRCPYCGGIWGYQMYKYVDSLP